MTDRHYWYELLKIETISNGIIDRLLDIYGSPAEIMKRNTIPEFTDFLQIKFAEVRSREREIASEYDHLMNQDIHMCLRDDRDFPEKLKNIPDRPCAIFVKGKLPPPAVPAIAIVGARKATPHGRWLAEKFAGELAVCGFSVISGMAEGIDGSGHRGTLAAGGLTYAVLGCGIDICYPRCHEKLYDQISKNGGIISEYPPGTPGLAYYFPKRNRIISALSDIVLVVEAREKSGSLITVSYALEQGRDVMAVPGRPDDAVSFSCNRLIREGAGICTCTEDILTQLDLLVPPEERISDSAAKLAALDESETAIYNLLSGTPLHTDELIIRTGLSYSNLIQILISLELKGLATSPSNNMYQKK